MAPGNSDDPSPDGLLELTIGPPAHGGHCVARHEGRVVFVRHALPGERVLAQVTERTSRYWRAEAVGVLDPSPDRVRSIWPEAGPGGVGGGELAHVALAAQREWKRAVVLDALRRIGHIDRDHPALADFDVQHVPTATAGPGAGSNRLQPEASGNRVPARSAGTTAASTAGSDDGTGYRTRVTLIADDDGRLGMYRHRSEAVLALREIPLAHPAIQELDLLARRWPPGARVQAVAPSAGPPVVLVDGKPVDGGRSRVREVVQLGEDTYQYRVSAAGFWQVHAGAPATLAGEVIRAGAPGTGQHVMDLYSGAGLFTTPLAGAVGPSGRLDAAEGSAGAARDARRNAHGLPQVHLHHADVASFLGGARARAGGGAGAPGRSPDSAGAGDTGARATPDVVVLDPPRAGAGQRVMRAIGSAGPRRIVYVACDPAALARDVATARDCGYELLGVRGFDIFPHTHHVECVALLRLPGQ